jgi:hypothetical protein
MVMVQSTSDYLSQPPARIIWPEGKRFAFTIFDDPDFQTVEGGRPVYDLLTELGFRTTKGIWPNQLSEDQRWGTCADENYLNWVSELHRRGFEIGWHGARPTTSDRPQTSSGLERFKDLFGGYPETMSQHYDCKENLYWGDERLTGGVRRLAYNLLTRFKHHGEFRGHVPGDDLYWSDLCRDRIKYVRNFVFSDINTLAACPFMPYHDPSRPDVAYWYSSSEGHKVETFVKTVSLRNQERLEEEGGACIMYTHFAYGFVEKAGKLNSMFRSLMESLAKRQGWFVPVSTLLDFILASRGPLVLDPLTRGSLEWKWLFHKIRYGSA